MSETSKPTWEPKLRERERLLREEWDACEGHEWRMSGWVIDVAPPIDTWFCEKCGAATHDPAIGDYCFIKHMR